MNPENVSTRGPTWAIKAFDLIAELTAVRDAYEATRAARGFVDLPIMLRSLCALFLICALAAFCMRAVRLLLPHASAPLRWSSAMMLGVWISTVGFHILRALGAFNLVAALVPGALLAYAAVGVRPERAPLARVLRFEWRSVRALTRLLFHGRYAIINAFFALFGALYALRALVVPPLGWDTLTYHGPRAVQWVQTGQFSFDPGPGPLSLYRNFFGGSELLMAWAMLPLHSDLLVNLAGIVQWLAVGLSVWSLARAVGLREPYAACSGAASMFISTLQLELNSGYGEIILNAALMHGIALSVRGLKRPRGALFVLAAMSLGVAAGIKLPGAPPGFIVLLALCVRLVVSRSVALPAKLRSLSAALVAAALPVLPWIFFAWRDTGYPLSPMPVELLGHKLGVADHALRWYQSQLVFERYDFQVEKNALSQVFTTLGTPFNESLGSLAIIPVLVAPFGAVAMVRRRPLAGAVVCMAAVVSLGIYYSRGMSPVRILWAVSSSRFLIPVIIFAIIMSLAWCRRDGWLSIAYRRLLLAYPLTYALIAVHWGRAPWETRQTVIVALFLWAVVTVAAAAFRFGGTRLGFAALVLLLAFSASFLQLRADQNRVSAFRESFAMHGSPRQWADLLPFVEHGRPCRIAVTAGPYQRADQWFFYAFYGQRLQNEIRYVPPTRDGGIAHFGPEGDLEQRADLQAWESRLDKAGIDLVLTFAPISIEQSWMDAAPERFRRLGGGLQGGLYERANSARPNQAADGAGKCSGAPR